MKVFDIVLSMCATTRMAYTSLLQYSSAIRLVKDDGKMDLRSTFYHTETEGFETECLT